MARSQTVGEHLQHRLHDLQEQVEMLQKKLQPGRRSKRHGFKLSEVEFPKVDLSGVKLPKVDMPEVHMPNVRLPRRNVPKFHMGRLKLLTAALGLLLVNRWMRDNLEINNGEPSKEAVASNGSARKTTRSKTSRSRQSANASNSADS